MKELPNQILTVDKSGSVGVSTLRMTRDQKLSIEDRVAIEEPLEIVLNHGDKRQTVSITMRTPGNDPDLVMGFLYAEGIIHLEKDVSGLSYWGPKVGPLNIHNTLVADLRRAPGTDLKRLERNFFTHAGCGICGKTALEALIIPRAPEQQIMHLLIPPCCGVCPQECVMPRMSLREPVACMQRQCLMPGEIWFLCLRISVGTMPWTNWWAICCNQDHCLL